MFTGLGKISRCIVYAPVETCSYSNLFGSVLVAIWFNNLFTIMYISPSLMIEENIIVSH